ncbi:DUF2809 domain-containing protein [Citricoccus sp. I39-566]|uniref:ribosomal maturation YjgA family protein n=1 Tax=Citricoccus sp. I39-566 TaxID=3073268 RepID=UPI00286BAE0B|nr:DUF2809 domain-containing protein [Citricoccus sp. I39-566]WMY76878.1 DUF2809 domain-containing protein [Citricoccus sp. I39-566]
MNSASSSSSSSSSSTVRPPAAPPGAGRSAEVRDRRRPRRPALAAAAVATVGLGLGVRSLAEGAWTGPTGDALYAVLVYLIVAWCAPRRAPRVVTGVAVVLCWLIELFQLTGLPLALAEEWWPARLVLGTGFAWVDLLSYAAGGAVAGAVDALLGRRLRVR